MKWGHILRVVVVASFCLVQIGCLALMPSPFRPSPGPTETPKAEDLAQAFEVVCRNYLLGPDDVVKLIYQTEWSIPEGSYRLDTLDEIRIEFILDPDLNRTVTIRPDGMITLPGVGEVRAAGLSPGELAKRISDKYKKTGIFKEEADTRYSDYRLVTVTVLQFYQKVRKLVESLTTLTSGQQALVTVKPDGTIDLPLLKERILAAGYTVADVERKINQSYRGVLDHVVASLSLEQARSRRVYVLGQVRNPGAYDIRQPITALHALSLAGGHIPETADLTSVILISKDINGKPIGRRLDLKKILDVGDMSPAILVKPYDVIYVPKTYIRDMRVFMEQYFATVADFTGLVGVLTAITGPRPQR
jgi:protein involved in polysaccharide export with SLBB domain